MDKLPRGILEWGKKCRLVTGLFTGQWTLKWHLHFMGLSENAMCRKCDKEVESPYHILCPRIVLTKHRVEIFDSAWMQLTDIRWASIKMILALALRSAPYQDQQCTMNPAVFCMLVATDNSPS
jgi:hypothetical protein